jgi:tetratricopeptide (TPR) repeat protein
MKSPNSALPINHYRAVEDVMRAEDVHLTQRVDHAEVATGLFIALAIVLTLLHAFNLYLWLGTSLGLMIPLILHLMISGGAALLTWGYYRRGVYVAHLAMLVIVSSVTGIFGALGSLFGYLVYLFYTQNAQSFPEWYESIFPADIPSEPQKIYDDILEGIDENPRAYSVMPLVEVMQLGSEHQKRRALARMTSCFNPRLAPAFKIALKDPSNTIRVQAATAVAKIEKGFMAQRDQIEMARVKEPQNTKLLLALAHFFDDYAFTGMLDATLEKSNRERAVETYKSYLQHDPDNKDAWMAIGRLFYRDGKWQDAAEWFRHALDRDWHMPAMILWYAECLFRLGNYAELRRIVAAYGRGIISEESWPRDVRDAMNLWAQAA